MQPFPEVWRIFAEFVNFLKWVWRQIFISIWQPCSDLPTIVSRKYAYADDLAIMHADGDWQVVEGVLSKNMATVGEYTSRPGS